jgi:acyl-[acyl-carrier-protein]-phospholipid O-acyltransferase/long-chain-fatty-acid--[acyl-carrier-protein] ligase
MATMSMISSGFSHPAPRLWGQRILATVLRVMMPVPLLKVVLKALLKLVFRVEVAGAENMPLPGAGAVVVVNHVSYLDGLLLAVFLPGRPTFAVHTRIAEAWWMKPVLPFFDAFAVDTTNPLSVKAMVKAVRDGRTLVIFPEGRITVTGALMKVFAGPGMVADKAGAPVIPVRVDGAQYTHLSHMKGKARLRLFPKIRLTVLPPRRFDLGAEESARTRRAMAAERLYSVMSEMMFETADIDRSLFQALLDARAIHGAKAPAVEDVNRAPLSYGRLILGARLLAKTLAPHTARGEAVGLMLPNMNPAVATFFALQAGGRVPAMLNYSAGPAHLTAACDAAEVHTIVCAHAFVEKAKLENAVAQLEATGRRFVWLEDLAADIGPVDKLIGLITAPFAEVFAHRQRDANRPAVILFTSGSEGTPKGVVLTHRNILANCAQIGACVDFNPTDRVLNARTLLPLFNGVRTLLYPNPLHYGAVPAFAYDASATILFGSDTFLSGYARAAQSYDFYSLRYIFAGAEPVKPETRAQFADKFGLRILEGYGATECAPVVAVNTPMHFKAGSVGRLLPGIEARLDAVPGIGEGGRLFVRGPNVMAGYVLTTAPGELAPPPGGWHDTGDIVCIDPQGFVTIKGRAKRFAKIGGEMVSLGAAEGYAAALWPDAVHAVVSRPDPRKGEELVLFSTAPGANPAAILAWGRAHGVAELMLPKTLVAIDAIPALATGKPDYVALKALACQPAAKAA